MIVSTNQEEEAEFMRTSKLGSRLVLFLAGAVLVIGASSAFGCAICKASPDGVFAFCKWGYDRGWNQCTGTTRNQFSGATDCDLEDPSCGTNACYWTDESGNCVAAY